MIRDHQGVPTALVIGGEGHYGTRTTAAVRRLGYEVRTAGRSHGDVRLDLTKPDTWEAVTGFDAVLNASDSVGADPTAFAEWCLRSGSRLIEMGAETTMIESLLALRVDDPKGSVLVGAGVFPGLSTALALSVPAAEEIAIGVRLSPVSGSGPGNCALMARMLADPSVWWEDGARQSGPPVGPPLALPFPGGSALAHRVALPDAPLLAHATGCPRVTAHLATQPGWMRFNLKLLGGLVYNSGPLKRWMEQAALWSLYATRGLLLRTRTTAIDLVVRTDQGRAAVRFEDGMAATGAGGAAVLACMRRQAPPPGVHVAGSLYSFEQQARHLENLGVRMSRHSYSTDANS